jgi:hypothetical protein
VELIPFQFFGNREFLGEGVVRQGVPTREIVKPRNAKVERVHRFSQSLCQGVKGTGGFIQRVPAGARRAISAQEREQSRDREVSGPC